jgi:hypothetical protein
MQILSYQKKPFSSGIIHCTEALLIFLLFIFTPIYALLRYMYLLNGTSKTAYIIVF